MSDNLFLVPRYGAPVEDTAKHLYKPDDSKTREIFRQSPGFTGTDEQRQQIENLAACGMSKEEIALCLKIRPELIDTIYKFEVETGAARINAEVARVALGMALSGANPDMTKFWLKTRANWVETKRIENTGANGGPIEYSEVKQRVLNQLRDELIEAEFTMVEAEKLR